MAHSYLRLHEIHYTNKIGPVLKQKIICKEHKASIIIISREVVEIHSHVERVDCTSQHCRTQIGNFIVHREWLSLLLARRSLSAS